MLLVPYSDWESTSYTSVNGQEQQLWWQANLTRSHQRWYLCSIFQGLCLEMTFHFQKRGGKACHWSNLLLQVLNVDEERDQFIPGFGEERHWGYYGVLGTPWGELRDAEMGRDQEWWREGWTWGPEEMPQVYRAFHQWWRILMKGRLALGLQSCPTFLHM